MSIDKSDIREASENILKNVGYNAAKQASKPIVNAVSSGAGVAAIGTAAKVGLASIGPVGWGIIIAAGIAYIATSE